jgi:2'-5' RNA ligase
VRPQPGRWRLFIAHPLPVAVREHLWDRLAPYRERYREVRWTRPDSWHLTLLFVGSVDPARASELEALVEAVAAKHRPYRVRVDLGGGRLRRGDGVAWLGLSEGSETLLDMAREVAARCPADITDGAPPKRTPAAHLTVARKADAEVIEALRRQALGPLSAVWTIDRLALVRSHLERGGARYETLVQGTL